MTTTASSLRFGVTLPTYPKGATVEGVLKVIQAAEDLGFSSAWTTDHVILPRDTAGPYESIFEPLMTLAHAAGFTRSLTLGISVIVVPQRNGIILAKQLATLDHLCQGRLIVGVGAGWSEPEFQMLGYGDRFGVRGAQLDETIRVWRHLWSTPEDAFQGDFYNLPGTAFGPAPLQPGGPPIWVGGASTGARRRAGRVGAAWHPVGMSAEDITRLSPVVQDVAEAEGRPVPMIAPRLPMRMGTDQVAAPTNRKMTVLSGDADQMIAHMQQYRDAGVEEVICLFGSPDGDEVVEQMTRFSREVMPSFA